LGVRGESHCGSCIDQTFCMNMKCWLYKYRAEPAISPYAGCRIPNIQFGPQTPCAFNLLEVIVFPRVYLNPLSYANGSHKKKNASSHSNSKLSEFSTEDRLSCCLDARRGENTFIVVVFVPSAKQRPSVAMRNHNTAEHPCRIIFYAANVYCR
jgi:hypothetical protein